MSIYRKVKESQTLLINTQSKLRADQNQKVIKFGFGQSPFLPPSQVIEALRNAAIRKEYTSVQGNIELREAISKFHFDFNGLESTADNILVAPGSKILIYTILQAFVDADVLIPEPSWVSYAPQAEIVGHHIIPVKTSFDLRWRVTVDAIRLAYSQKKTGPTIMILNYPGNPDGLTYATEELQAIAKVCKELDILVIADEIYGPLTFHSGHLSLANFYPEKTITTSGLSKWCGAGGWRLGIAILYPTIEIEFKQALIGIASETYSCAPSPVQIAAQKAYENYDSVKEYIAHQNKILSRLAYYIYKELTSIGILLHKSQGAFYLLPDFSPFKEVLFSKGISTSAQLTSDILEKTGVALLPGSAFGLKDDYLAARLAFVDFDPESLGSETEFDIDKHCPNVVKGVEALKLYFSEI